MLSNSGHDEKGWLMISTLLDMSADVAVDVRGNLLDEMVSCTRYPLNQGSNG
jgi:hypothetical protein